MHQFGRHFVIFVGTLAFLVGCRRSQDDVAREPPENSGEAATTRDVAHEDAEARGVPDASAPVDPLAIPSASVAAVVNPAHLPAYSGPTGAVEGTVRIVGPDAPEVPGLVFRSCPAAIDMYGKAFRSGVPREDGSRALADALVVVTGYSGYIEEKEPAVRVTVDSTCSYPSRTIAMTFGQRLEVTNDTKLPFGPYLVDTYTPVVRVAPPMNAGDPVRIYPPRADYFHMKDRLQPFIHEDVYVLRQPLHAVTDVAGHFRIAGVPAGHVTVSARLPMIGTDAARDVEVRAGAATGVELTLTYTVPAPAPASSKPIVR
jgi:hypothetical protein